MTVACYRVDMTASAADIIGTTARTQCLDLIAGLGADLDTGAAQTQLEAEVLAPAGHLWIASGSHSLALVFRSPRRAGWAQLLEDLREGVSVRACSDPQCDHCADEPHPATCHLCQHPTN